VKHGFYHIAELKLYLYLFLIFVAFIVAILGSYLLVLGLLIFFQIGKTKVFLRAGQMADLDARRAEVLGRAARIIQRQISTYIARKQFVELKRSATQLQSFVRGTPYFCASVRQK